MYFLGVHCSRFAVLLADVWSLSLCAQPPLSQINTETGSVIQHVNQGFTSIMSDLWNPVGTLNLLLQHLWLIHLKDIQAWGEQFITPASFSQIVPNVWCPDTKTTPSKNTFSVIRLKCTISPSPPPVGDSPWLHNGVVTFSECRGETWDLGGQSAACQVEVRALMRNEEGDNEVGK